MSQITEKDGYYAYGVLHKSKRYTDWEVSGGEKYRSIVQSGADVPQRRILDHFPRLNVEVTTKCNLACGFVHTKISKNLDI